MTKKRIDHLKNFGFANEVTVLAAGINGKMNEVQAALGLLQLQHVDRLIARRAEIASLYDDGLRSIDGIRLPFRLPDTQPNHSYYPIFIGDGFPIGRDAVYARLREHGVYARRYFYPLLSDMPMYRELPSAAPGRLPNAGRISREVLCLPIYPALADDDVTRVIELIRACLTA